MALDEEQGNFNLFRECLSGPIIELSAVAPLKSSRKKSSKGRSNIKKVDETRHDRPDEDSDTVEDLADFIDVITSPACCESGNSKY